MSSVWSYKQHYSSLAYKVRFVALFICLCLLLSCHSKPTTGSLTEAQSQVSAESMDTANTTGSFNPTQDSETLDKSLFNPKIVDASTITGSKLASNLLSLTLPDNLILQFPEPIVLGEKNGEPVIIPALTEVTLIDYGTYEIDLSARQASIPLTIKLLNDSVIKVNVNGFVITPKVYQVLGLFEEVRFAALDTSDSNPAAYIFNNVCQLSIYGSSPLSMPGRNKTDSWISGQEILDFRFERHGGYQMLVTRCGYHLGLYHSEKMLTGVITLWYQDNPRPYFGYIENQELYPGSIHNGKLSATGPQDNEVIRYSASFTEQDTASGNKKQTDIVCYYRFDEFGSIILDAKYPASGSLLKAVQVYSGPSSDKAVGTFPPADPVIVRDQVVKEKITWLLIEQKGLSGWVPGSEVNVGKNPELDRILNDYFSIKL